MFCAACGFTRSAGPGVSMQCQMCGQGLTLSADDIFVHGHGSIVREVRPAQATMGRLVENVISNKLLGLVEGPVGIGKSFAYAIPAILSKKRVVITTAKKQLQHQLARKDLPYLIDRLGSTATVVLLKGKSNYACELRAQTLAPAEKGEFLGWLQKNPAGDLTDWTSKRPAYWSEITAEDCIGRSCRYANKCGYWRSKQQLKTAQIVVGNHHVLAWDLKFGPRKLLGDYEVLIMDEAHQAVSAFRGAYSKTLTPFSLRRLIKQIDRIGFTTDLDKKLETAWKQMFTEIQHLDGEVVAKPFGDAGDVATELFAQLAKEVKQEMASEGVVDDEGDAAADPDYLENLGHEGQNQARVSEYALGLQLLQAAASRVTDALAATVNPDPNDVIFINTTERGHKVVNVSPIDIGAAVGPKLLTIPSVVVTSATIAVGGDFKALKRQMGLDKTLPILDNVGAPTGERQTRQTEEAVLSSPFDFRRQALLYTPTHLPLPVSAGERGFVSDARRNYVSAMCAEIERLLTVSQGNAFVLFTSTADMRDFYQAIEDTGTYKDPIFMQTDDAEGTLRQFMATPRSTVFGLKSFWEGVDVQGDKLHLVIMPKLPFPQVKDPVLQAQSRLIKQAAVARGLSESSAETQVFRDLQTPLMLTDLRQGAGRLIRSADDRGVLAILDVRVWTGSSKRTPTDGQRNYLGYGAQVVNATCFSNRTADFELVRKFLQKLCADEVARVAKIASNSRASAS